MTRLSALAAMVVHDPAQTLGGAGMQTLLASSRYVRGLGVTVLCTVIAYPVYPNFDPVNIVMIYLLGTTLAALRLGRGPSALTAIANTIAFDYFFVPPRYSFYIAETQYLFTMGVMLGVALVIANLMVSVRRQTIAAAERERRTSLLYAVSRELTAAPDAPAVANVAARHVVAAVDGVASLLCVDEHGRLIETEPSRGAIPDVDLELGQQALDQERAHGLGTSPSESSRSIYLPLAVRGRKLGVLIAHPRDPERLGLEQREFLEALGAQVALALERVRLTEVAADSRAAAERAALRNTLLASISHDLRGPLSVIAGAGSLVAQANSSLDRHRRTTLGQLIEEKARDMTDLLSNVLELMKLETSNAPLSAEWHSIDDLLGTAVRNIEYRLGDRQLTTAIPPDLPMICVDGRLIVQLFSNLLENATKHTQPATSITVRAASRGRTIVLTIEDNGPGFGARQPERLFEKFERGQAEGHVSGVGLGLAICRAIVLLHGGSIRAANRPEGGARFEIELPISLPLVRLPIGSAQ